MVLSFRYLIHFNQHLAHSLVGRANLYCVNPYIERNKGCSTAYIISHQLATFYAANNEPDRAIHQLQSILKVDPGDAGALFSLAHLEAARRSFETALELLERAYAVAPRQPEVIDSYAWLSYLMQDLATARRVVEQGGLYYEGHADFEQRRRTILAAEKAATP